MAMRPLTCRSCGCEFLVEKFSAAHTSIQWTSDADDCPMISAAHHGYGEPDRTCVELRSTVDAAVADHRIEESRIELPVGDAIPRLH